MPRRGQRLKRCLELTDQPRHRRFAVRGKERCLHSAKRLGRERIHPRRGAVVAGLKGGTRDHHVVIILRNGRSQGVARIHLVGDIVTQRRDRFGEVARGPAGLIDTEPFALGDDLRHRIERRLDRVRRHARRGKIGRVERPALPDRVVEDLLGRPVRAAHEHVNAELHRAQIVPDFLGAEQPRYGLLSGVVGGLDAAANEVENRQRGHQRHQWHDDAEQQTQRHRQSSNPSGQRVETAASPAGNRHHGPPRSKHAPQPGQPRSAVAIAKRRAHRILTHFH